MNAIVFTTFGIAVGVQTHFPFPLMAALSAVLSIGLMPWLLRKTGERYIAILSGALLVLAAELMACVVARIVYGPNFNEQGYIAGDWRTAKLMISLFWVFSACFRWCCWISNISVVIGTIEFCVNAG